MPKTAPLWDSGARKEAFELLEHLWFERGDHQIRARLAEALANGPPEHLGEHEDSTESERQALRDRRIFDRIGVLLRGNQAVLPAELNAIYAAIMARHPEWQPPEDEKARFHIWVEPWEPDTPYSVDYLRNIVDTESLLHILCTEQEHREGLLESWRQLVGTEFDRGLAVLEMLSGRGSGGPPDIWRTTLSGLRGRAKEEDLHTRLIELLSMAPQALFNEVEYSRAVADLLLELRSPLVKERPSESFWRLFDRALRASEADPANSEEPRKGDWVTLAINRSLGHLATAFFNAIFAYQLKVSNRIPIEHRVRLDQLVGITRRDHRLARVVAVSRLPYLFAVDPDWTRATLIPSMDWANEDEAMALWQGFAWQPRIGPELWADICKPFLAAFTSDRMERFGDFERTMAQLLMLAGVEFRREDLSADQARAAIRAMNPTMREESISWLWHYLTQGAVEGDALRGERADALWRDRVQPWLNRAWPHERDLLTKNLAVRFALLTTATSNAFPDAVDFVLPFLIPTDASLVLRELNRTNHPEQYPEATLRLLTAIWDPNVAWSAHDFREILAKVLESSPALRDEPDVRKYQEWLKILSF
jgi:hypothetical protein